MTPSPGLDAHTSLPWNLFKLVVWRLFSSRPLFRLLLHEVSRALLSCFDVRDRMERRDSLFKVIVNATRAHRRKGFALA